MYEKKNFEEGKEGEEISLRATERVFSKIQLELKHARIRAIIISLTK